ncbi:mpv17-like protein [Arapaima gigas]
MSRIWSSVKSHPYIANIVGYTALFATADVIQQSVLGPKWVKNDSAASGTVTSETLSKMRIKSAELQGSVPAETEPSNSWKAGQQTTEPSSPKRNETRSAINWPQTARVALVGFCFHANFNYHWLKWLERMWPGGRARTISWKVLLDQVIAAPATISVFYIGNTLEGRQDIFEDWREKFWTSYKTGVIYWSTMQAVNFLLVPPVARTVFVGGIALGWTVFLCHLRHQRGRMSE